MTEPNRTPRLLAVTPARNEVTLLPGLIESMTSQSTRPAAWMLVDDGSNDGTLELMQAAAAEHEWIHVVQRADRGARKLGGGVVEAFREGLTAASGEFDFYAKVDADLTFGERYLERLFEHFEEDDRLGSASGKVFRPESGRLVEEFMIDDMVAGQFKVWRRSCYEAIGGLVDRVMWDGIDFHRARMEGWLTRSIAEPELQLIHHRLMGSSDRSVFRGRLRWGRGQWFMGSHPLYVLASAAWRSMEQPRLVGGALIAAGYAQAALSREPRYEDGGFRRSLRSWQMGRLGRLLTRGEVR